MGSLEFRVYDMGVPSRVGAPGDIALPTCRGLALRQAHTTAEDLPAARLPCIGATCFSMGFNLFRAMPSALVLEHDGHAVHASVRDLDEPSLADGDVCVEVLYSSLNYKDALAVTGKGKIIRGSYPFVPGIDLSGRVFASRANRYRMGDLVLGTGAGLGELHWGGYAERQCVGGTRLIPLPVGLSPERAMVAGTAGFTAMLACMQLERHGATPGEGEVLVTGASGGVGSFAVALLSAMGYSVTASTGSPDAHDWLRGLGADRILDREELSVGATRPLDSARWTAAVDVAGGKTLEAVLSRTGWHGVVAACGLTDSATLNTTVFPFILRGVRLIGIDSNTCPEEVRLEAWARLSEHLTEELAEDIRADTIGLPAIPAMSDRLLAGHVRGRVVVDVGA